ncbi:hypothetical protein GCM10020331_010420 [Ectobacillus funiculus]
MLIRLAELYEVPIEYIISGVKVSKSTSPDMQDLLGDISQLSQSDIELIKTLVERLKQKLNYPPLKRYHVFEVGGFLKKTKTCTAGAQPHSVQLECGFPTAYLP